MLRKKRVAVLSALIVTAAAGAALSQGGMAQSPAAQSPQAQSPQAKAGPPDARQACRASAFSLCRPEISAHSMSAVRACLVRNFDKVSPDCQAAMRAVRDREADPNAQPGPDSAPAPAPQSPPPHR